MCAHVLAHTRSSEDNSWRRVLSCYLVGSKDWIQVTQPAPVCAGLLPAEPPWEWASECTPHRNNKLIVLSNYFGTINLTMNRVRKKKVGWHCPNNKPPAGRDPHPVSTLGLGCSQLNGNDCWLGLLSATREYLLLWVIIQEAEVSSHHTPRSCNGDYVFVLSEGKGKSGHAPLHAVEGNNPQKCAKTSWPFPTPRLSADWENSKFNLNLIFNPSFSEK